MAQSESVSIIPQSYECFFFRQRPESPVQCTFVASSADISDWSSVPQKAATDLKNFQRPEIPDHVSEISEFFKNFPTNSSPSAIVLGFSRKVKCTDREGRNIDLGSLKHGQVVPGKIEIPSVEISPPSNIAEKRKTLRELIALLETAVSQEQK